MVRHQYADGVHSRPSDRHRFAVFGTFLSFVLVLSVFCGHAGNQTSLEAYADVADASSLSPDAVSSTSQIRASDVERLVAEINKRLDEDYAPARQAQTTDVRAGDFLLVTVHVRGDGGTPVVGAEVILAWSTARGVTYRTAVTNRSGVASVRQWIAERDRGKRIILGVWATDGRRSASSYTWFVPQ